MKMEMGRVVGDREEKEKRIEEGLVRASEDERR